MTSQASTFRESRKMNRCSDLWMSLKERVHHNRPFTLLGLAVGLATYYLCGIVNFY